MNLAVCLTLNPNKSITQTLVTLCLRFAFVHASSDSTVRLVGGRNVRSGRVEVLFSGKWGTICSEGFNVNAANVICRMVGFRFWSVLHPLSSYR